MKLGATITSERGKPVTKTGNEHLIISINDEKQKQIAYCVIDENMIVFSIINGEVLKVKRNGNLKHANSQTQ